MDAGDMTDRDRSLSWRVAAVVGRTLAKALGFFPSVVKLFSVVKFFSVVKPPEQMNAQTMLPPEAFPPRADEYRP